MSAPNFFLTANQSIPTATAWESTTVKRWLPGVSSPSGSSSAFSLRESASDSSAVHCPDATLSAAYPMIDCSTHSAYSEAVIGRSADRGFSEVLLIEQSSLEEAPGGAVVQIEVAVDAVFLAREVVSIRTRNQAGER